jgi:WD40 repeat protein
LHLSLFKGTLSDAGYYLVSAGFDKTIKVWDFNIMGKDN